MIIDTHIHLDNEQYQDDVDAVIQRARAEGVQAFIIPGADPKTVSKAKELSKENGDVFYASGVHPYDIEAFDAQRVLKEGESKRCVAIGECGLDYFRLPEDEEKREAIKQAQKRVFIEQIQIAKSLKKPLIIHIREASRDAKEILLSEGASEVGGVLHCYNADHELLSLADKNFYFGIGGVLTFKNARKLVEVLPKIPLNRLLVETDGPYLTPHPYRGSRNEPRYTTLVIKKMAQLLNKEEKEVAILTTTNAKRLFRFTTHQA